MSEEEKDVEETEEPKKKPRHCIKFGDSSRSKVRCGVTWVRRTIPYWMSDPGEKD